VDDQLAGPLALGPLGQLVYQAQDVQCGQRLYGVGNLGEWPVHGPPVYRRADGPADPDASGGRDGDRRHLDAAQPQADGHDVDHLDGDVEGRVAARRGVAEQDVGQPKAQVAAKRLRALNSLVEVVAVAERFRRDNALDLVRSSDVVGRLGGDRFGVILSQCR